MWVLLDFDGLPVRYYTYPAKGTVEIVKKKLTFKEMIDLLGESPI